MDGVQYNTHVGDGQFEHIWTQELNAYLEQ